MNPMIRITASAAAAGFATLAVAGPVPTPVDVIITEGQALAGDTVDIINEVVATPGGTVGFTGSLLASGDRFVWSGTGPIIFNSDYKQLVTGAEGSMGVGDAGGSIYSPAVDGNDSVIINGTEIISKTQPSFDGVPGFITFCSRPQMTGGGIAHWISGYNDTDPNGGSQARVLYRWENGAVTAVQVAGDPFMYEGTQFFVGPGSGVDFDYGISPDGSQRIQAIDTTAPTANDGFVLINGVGTYREDDPIPGEEENWDNFDLFRIDDAGNHAFTGDTNGPGATDEFVAYNGQIVVRSGDMIGGEMIPDSATLRGLDLSNDGGILHAWGTTSFEILFVGDTSNVAATSQKIVAWGDVLDTDGDGLGDVTVIDIEASTVGGSGGAVIDGTSVYVNLEVENDAAETFEIIARFDRPDVSNPCFGDLDGDGEVGFTDLTALLAAWGDVGMSVADLNGDMVVNFSDLTALLSAYGPCV
ncbi:MAG: hypothetical protein AB8G96_13505 [Phycisphaerales bacterium]